MLQQALLKKKYRTPKKKPGILLNPNFAIMATSPQQTQFHVTKWLLWRSLTVIQTIIPSL